MSDPLATYLHDHLAGAAHAIELVKDMRDKNSGDPLGDFAARLLTEIQTDRDTLQQIANRVGAASDKLKNVAGWMSEKIARLKLGHDSGDALGIFEALEFLELGIHGKRDLWSALRTAATTDTRLQGVDFGELEARAEAQRNSVDELRLGFVRKALSPKVSQKS